MSAELSQFMNNKLLSDDQNAKKSRSYLLAFDRWLSAGQSDHYFRLSGVCFGCLGRTDNPGTTDILNAALICFFLLMGELHPKSEIGRVLCVISK